MANEKTEKATPKRRNKERDKGNISKSQDFVSSITLTVGVACLYVLTTNMLEHLKNLMRETFGHLHPATLPKEDYISVFVPSVHTTVAILLPFFFFISLAALFVKRSEVGALFAKDVLKPKIDKLLPANALRALWQKINIFSPKTLVEFAKSIAKLIAVGIVGTNVIIKRKEDLFGLLGVDMETALSILGSVIMEILIAVCIIMLIIGIIDKKFQDYEYEKSIKMTKQEVKDEWKNAEGDPVIKGKIRSIQMKFAQQRMMGGVKQSDVVVTNPTHYAVAIKYDQQEQPVPKVMAKGVDLLAFKIREVAKANGIPIVENKPLARSLYKLVPIDGIIPPELYVAVAEVLSFVFKNRTK
ncbi:flagellar biosynthesis protein FlhB [bacterium]|nr:flagellar biosynthesis protein FlhB [bacterium]